MYFSLLIKIKLAYVFRHMPMCMLSHFSHVQLFGTLWTTALQAPLSMGFSRQEYWNGLPFLPPGDLLNPGIKPVSLMSTAVTFGFFTTSTTWEALQKHVYHIT